MVVVVVIVAVIAVVALVALAIELLSRAARKRGYTLGSNTVVRCKQGHLFTTIWVPGASIKSVRLGLSRFQHCPVGHHWTIVKPVKDADLTPEDRARAAQTHDLRVP
jgi:hypothetical protein